VRRVRLLRSDIRGARQFGRAPAVLLAVALLAACGAAGRGSSGTGPTPTASAAAVPVPAVITEADGGKTFRVSPGDEPHLRLSGQYVWTPPRATGPIQLTPIEFFRDPGYSEWTIRAQGSGTATIRSSGSPNCPKGSTCRLGPAAFAVTLVVG
jgi:hypothetical protein